MVSCNFDLRAPYLRDFLAGRSKELFTALLRCKEEENVGSAEGEHFLSASPNRQLVRDGLDEWVSLDSRKVLVDQERMSGRE